MSVMKRDEIKNIYDAFDYFKQTFLKDKKSIFSDNEIFTKENVKEIQKIFDGTRKDIKEKLENLKEPNEQNKPKAELLAHIIWLWSLAVRQKRDNKMNAVNDYLKEKEKVKDDSKLFFHLEQGLMNAGEWHGSNKIGEFEFITILFEKVLNDEEDCNRDEKYYEEKLKTIHTGPKAAMYNILLHLFNPDEFYHIAAFEQKKRIVSFFSDHFNLPEVHKEPDLDEQFKMVWDKCKEEFKSEYPYKTDKKDIYSDCTHRKGNSIDFFNEKLVENWKKDIGSLFKNKNMIYHGAPGTGKTYKVDKSISNRLKFHKGHDVKKQYKMVQFHPSYGYEDFIDGIKPVDIGNDGNMKFKLVNGLFKDMCIDAYKELVRFDKLESEEQKKEGGKPKPFFFVADEINRAELSRVFGELLLCIEDDKRLTVDKKITNGKMVKTQNSNLWAPDGEHAVVNEHGEMYFGVPENLFFIGTMNDIDRSVDSFDMALRRRFYWKHCVCEYEVIKEKFSNQPEETKIINYIKACEDLNKTISGSEGEALNLGESFEVGHSYFMKPNDINKTQIKELWENHLDPLLKEYLRAEVPSESEIKTKLKKLKDKFMKTAFGTE